MPTVERKKHNKKMLATRNSCRTQGTQRQRLNKSGRKGTALNGTSKGSDVRKAIKPTEDAQFKHAMSVISSNGRGKLPEIKLPQQIKPNKRLKMDGLKFLSILPAASITVSFFDPQYRGVLDKLGYGNEGKSRGRARSELRQMSEEVIADFIKGIDRALTPSGHLFLWIDKFHLCTGITSWLSETSLSVVDMMTWNKKRIGMGYRTRRKCEYLVILQKKPRRVKKGWKLRDIPDVWPEKAQYNGHTHGKPIELQYELIKAASSHGDWVIDPAAGSFSVMEACKLSDRNFLGCDLNG